MSEDIYDALMTISNRLKTQNELLAKIVEKIDTIIETSIVFQEIEGESG